ncbi:MAG: hypothetical protein AB7N54_01685 [Alphaproteobacteria bacterium]
MGTPLKAEELAGKAAGRQSTRRVLVDDEKMQLTYYNFAPGEETGWHTHPYDYVVVTFDEGQFELQTTDGKVNRIRSNGLNHYLVRGGMRHCAKNIGTTDITLIEIELKQAKAGENTPVGNSSPWAEAVAVLAKA